MKKTLLAIIIVSFVASCSSNTGDLNTEKNVTGINNPINYRDVLIDTAAIISGHINEDANEGYNEPVRKTTVRRSRPTRTRPIYNEEVAPTPIYRETPPAPPTPPVTTENTTVSTPANGPVGGDETNQTEAATVPSVPEKPKGWSKSAKGAVIGGVGGAVAGAVLSKNKVVGAIIGGVVGAGGGYVLGRSKDKKDGRVQYTSDLNQ